MKLSPHFTTEEFEASEMAARFGIDNRIPVSLMDEARLTATMMEAIREALSREANEICRINVTSAHRCLELNRRIGSSDTSDHILMTAVDFRSPDFGTPTEIARFLVPRMSIIGIGQIILEYPDQVPWVHVSRKMPAKMVNRVITIRKTGTTVGINP